MILIKALHTAAAVYCRHDAPSALLFHVPQTGRRPVQASGSMNGLRYWRRPVWRRRLAWLTLLAVLLQQLALIAYACPAEAAPLGSDTAQLRGCEGMEKRDPAAPTLCDQHCRRDQVATPDLKTPLVPPVALPAVDYSLSTAMVPAVRAQNYESVPLWQANPPPAQRFCSLQI